MQDWPLVTLAILILALSLTSIRGAVAVKTTSDANNITFYKGHTEALQLTEAGRRLTCAMNNR